MELKDCKVSIRVGCMSTDSGEPAKARFELYDQVSGTMFARITMTADQFAKALGGLGNVKVEKAEVFALHRLNKKHEHKIFDFPLPENVDFGDRKPVAIQAAKDAAPVGWLPDCSFGSQDSFFQKDGKPWARTIIRRWVEDTPDETEDKNPG